MRITKLYRSIILIFLLSTIPFILFARIEEADSLEIKLSETSNLNERLRITSEIAEIYEKISPSISLKYLAKSKLLSQQIGTDSLTAKILQKQGIIYNRIGDYENALEVNLQCLGIYEKMENKQGIANVLNNIGIINLRLYNTESLESLLEAKKIFTEIQDNIGLVKTLISIGSFYLQTQEPERALETYMTAKMISESLNEKRLLAICLNNIGLAHKQLQNKDLALEYYYKALEIKKQSGNKESICSSLINIASYHISFEEFDSAKKILFQALPLAKEVQSKDQIRRIYNGLHLCQIDLGDFESALDYYKKYVSIKDSVFSEKNQDRIVEMQIKFDTEQKEKMIEILDQKNKIQKFDIIKQRFFVAIALGLIILLAFIAFQQRKQYLLKHQINNILAQKNEEFRITNDKLKKSEIELKEINAAKDKFFSIFSHDLRNPISAILGLTEIFTAQYNDMTDDVKMRYLEMISESVKNSLKLLENLLTWSMSQTGNLAFKPEKLELGSIINHSIDLVTQQARNKHITINFQQIEKMFIYADLNMINTVIRNLIINAIKFSEVNSEVDIIQLEDNDFYNVSIKDYGVGIEPENLEKLFKLDSDFSRKGTQKEKGTGLGLILCKEFIEKNNGTISAESNFGTGSVFTIKLPKYQNQEKADFIIV